VTSSLTIKAADMCRSVEISASAGVGANDARRNACREILADRLDYFQVHALDMGA